MKTNILKLTAILLLMVGVFSFCKEKEETQEKLKEKVCNVENPVTDLPWLKEIIDGFENFAETMKHNTHAKIYQCDYKDGIGFLLEMCAECSNARYSFRNCEGVVLCREGFIGQNNCSELNIDFANKKLIWEKNATGDADAGINSQYYWSGGKKIWLDTDFSTVIVKFDNEQNLQNFVSSTYHMSSMLKSQPPIARIQLQSAVDDEIYREFNENSIISKTFAHKFNNSNGYFWINGDIILEPKEGITAEDIMGQYKINGEIVKETITGTIIVQLEDLSSTFDIANLIYESGLVNWCHPDFIAPRVLF